MIDVFALEVMLIMGGIGHGENDVYRIWPCLSGCEPWRSYGIKWEVSNEKTRGSE